MKWVGQSAFVSFLFVHDKNLKKSLCRSEEKQ